MSGKTQRHLLPFQYAQELVCALIVACRQCKGGNRGSLQELALLAALEQACEALLARCFENYAQLAEAAPSGVLEGGQAAPELPAPALLPAVELCNILRDALKPVDQARTVLASGSKVHRVRGGAVNLFPKQILDSL